MIVNFLDLDMLEEYGESLSITFGGMCMLAQLRGGACFCTRGAMHG